MGVVAAGASLQKKAKRFTQKATKDTKGWGTNSEGQVKYCRSTFFGHATPDRAGARPASNVGSRDVTWASQPHSHPYRVFACFASPFLRQSGRDRTQFLMASGRILHVRAQFSDRTVAGSRPCGVQFQVARISCAYPPTPLFASYADAAPAWVASLTSSSRPVLTL